MAKAEHAKWAGRVVVITGASAGVGRATALAFAGQGAQVALLARDLSGLEDTRGQIEAMGGRALVVPTDVSDPEAVFLAAEEVERAFGPPDIWVNNAMSTAFSMVGELTPAEVKRVNDVSFLGTVHGTLAALKSMKKRGRGVIIQISSGLAYRAIPLQSAYCAAKHAVRGFTESLRCELLAEGSGVRVSCVVLPGINTPQFEWALTHEPNRPRPVAPVYQPEVAARAILKAAGHPQREYFVGYQTPLLTMAAALMPGLMDRYLARNAIKGQDSGQATQPDRADNLFKPVTGRHATRGRFSGESHTRALVTPGGTARLLGLAALLSVGALVGACVATRKGEGR